MDIRCCNEVAKTDVVDIFNRGFSDYVIQHTWTQEAFEERFLGTEGNALEHSFIAYVDEKPIGLILGGIRKYDGIKTMRCGAMCLDPDYRGNGIAQVLFEYHRKHALKQSCRQLFLEVIKGNDRAIRFYEKCGYGSVYNILYHNTMIQELRTHVNKHKNFEAYTFTSQNIEQLQAFRNNLKDCHMNWQCEPEAFNNLNGGQVLAAHLNGQCIAMASMSPSGKVYFLWVASEFRCNGIASTLVIKLAELQEIEKVNFSTPNNSSFMGFFRKLNFERDHIEQYEMYLPL